MRNSVPSLAQQAAFTTRLNTRWRNALSSKMLQDHNVYRIGISSRLTYLSGIFFKGWLAGWL
jgi:hypothetical protein